MTDHEQAGALSQDECELLLIAYHYAPADHSGTRRVTAFARYLPQVGYRPLVLTTSARGSLPTDAAQCIVRANELAGLLSGPYRHLRLQRVSRQQRANSAAILADSRISRLLNAALIPDIHITWYPLAVRRGRQLLRTRPIRLILSSSPPNTSHLVAMRLKRLTGLPWVADFRDGWMFEPPSPAVFSSPLRARIELALERQVMATADQIVTVNEAISADMSQRYPAEADRLIVIPNGYDPADLAGMVPKATFSPKLRLVHTGSLALSRADTSIRGLLVALCELHGDAPGVARDLELVLVGQLSSAELALIGGVGLGDQLQTVGAVSHRQALQHQANADVLLLVTVPGTSSVTTSKLFEYLAIGRPILALTGQSPAARLISELEAGMIVAPDDVAGIKQALRTLHTRWRAGELPTRIDPRTACYSRLHLTTQLARCFDDLLGKPYL